MNKVFLKPNREKSLLKRHPWIYSGAIARVDGTPSNGSTVMVCSSKGDFLAWASISQESQLALRVWSFDEAAAINEDFFAEKLQYAMEMRQTLQIPQRTTAWRLCASESDNLPGVTIDVYNDYAVMQLTSAGADFQRENLVKALQKLKNCARFVL